MDHKINTAMLWCMFFFVLGVLSRIPFMSNMPYYVDASYYVTALDHYHPGLGLPSSMGYILYIALAKCVHLILQDSHMSYIFLSIFFSGVASSLIFLLGQEMFGRKGGIISAFLLLSSPLIWFNGEVVFSYMIVMSFSIAFVLLGLKNIKNPSFILALSCSLILAFIGGLRPQDLVLLGPAWLYIIFHNRKEHILYVFFILAAAVLAWLLPMIAFSGGLEFYLSSFLSEGPSLFGANLSEHLYRVGGNFEKFGKFLVRGLGVGVIFLFASIGRMPLLLRRENRLFLILLVPSLLFFLGGYLGNPGHMFATYFVYLLLVVFMLLQLKIQKWIVAIMVVSNVLIFTWGVQKKENWDKLTWYKASDIQNRNFTLKQKVDYIQKNFDPKTTLILGDMGGRGHMFQASYHLRDFRFMVVPYSTFGEPKSDVLVLRYPYKALPLRVNISRTLKSYEMIVLLDKDDIRHFQGDPDLKVISLISGVKIYFLKTTLKKLRSKKLNATVKENINKIAAQMIADFREEMAPIK